MNLHGSKWIRPAKRWAIYLRDGFRCVYCRRDLTDVHPAECTLDHRVSRQRGGSNHETNLVTACSTCNRGRWLTGSGRSRPTPPDVRKRIDRLIARPLDLLLARAVLAGTIPLTKALSK